MTDRKVPEKRIQVLGDGEVHANLVPGSGGGLTVNFELGGIWQTARLLRLLAEEELPGTQVDCLPEPDLERTCPDFGATTLFQQWASYPGAWRIERGIGRTVVEPTSAADAIPCDGQVVVLQDQKLGFVQTAALDFSGKPEWLIYAASPPLFSDPVWRQVYEHALDRTILVLDMEDLRQDFLSISEGISWEKTIENLMVEVYQHRKPKFFPLRECPYVLIRIGLSGLLLLENTEEQASHFVFDPLRIEGEYTRQHPGSMHGILESMLALLGVFALHGDLNAEKMRDYSLAALQLSRTIQREGGVLADGVHFPDAAVREAMKALLQGAVDGRGLARVSFRCEHLLSLAAGENGPSWSLQDIQQQTDYLELSKDIVRYGAEASLAGTPMCKMGHLLTIDRGEIESYRYLKKLMTSYLGQKRNSKPLSIAVFGFPGSGKSFGVKQIAKSLKDDGYNLTSMTFNLSQFNHPEELYQAFHQVRDIILSGQIPLIFWDEFDTEKLKWLRYFLAPMQDGQFQEGQLVHNIGEAVFIFAGGTCSSIEQFRDVCAAPEGKANKGPDFVSRLKGSISIMGPNSITCYQDSGSAEVVDPYWMLRRAILLRSMLEMGAPSIFEKRDKGKFAHVEDGVLNAFLNIPQYFHGARSIETILSISDLQGEPVFTRSLLPPASELGLHVDGLAFMNLVEEVVFSDEDIERMARAIHSVWQTQKTASGFSAGEGGTSGEYYPSLRAYEDLPLDEKRQNRTSARSILHHVRAVGLDLIPSTASVKPVVLPDEQVERLAELEHQRWVRTHIQAGWKYAPVKRKAFKEHDDLLAWDAEEQSRLVELYGPDAAGRMGKGVLPEPVRELDRVIVRAYPEILHQAGYVLVEAG